MKSNIPASLLLICSTISLTACSSPQDEASTISYELCESFKSDDFNGARDYATKDALVMWNTSEMSSYGKKMAHDSAKDFK